MLIEEYHDNIYKSKGKTRQNLKNKDKKKRLQKELTSNLYAYKYDYFRDGKIHNLNPKLGPNPVTSTGGVANKTATKSSKKLITQKTSAGSYYDQYNFINLSGFATKKNGKFKAKKLAKLAKIHHPADKSGASYGPNGHLVTHLPTYGGDLKIATEIKYDLLEYTDEMIEKNQYDEYLNSYENEIWSRRQLQPEIKTRNRNISTDSCLNSIDIGETGIFNEKEYANSDEDNVYDSYCAAHFNMLLPYFGAECPEEYEEGEEVDARNANHMQASTAEATELPNNLDAEMIQTDNDLYYAAKHQQIFANSTTQTGDNHYGQTVTITQQPKSLNLVTSGSQMTRINSENIAITPTITQTAETYMQTDPTDLLEQNSEESSEIDDFTMPEYEIAEDFMRIDVSENSGSDAGIEQDWEIV